MKSLRIVLLGIFFLSPNSFLLEAEYILTPLGPEGGEVFDIVFDPQNGEIAYAAVYSGGIYRSVDGGRSWLLFVPNNKVGNYVGSLAVDPGNSNIIYAAGNGVYKSEDGGETWQDINPEVETTHARDILIDVNNTDTIFVGSETGIFKSTNRGRDWTSINSGLTNLNISSLTIGSSNPQVLYAGSWEAPLIFKSTNGGVTWSVVYSGSTGAHIRRIAVSPANADIVLTSDTNIGLLKTTDGGGTWEKVSNICAGGIAFDPIASNIVYISVDLEGIEKSVDGGSTWAYFTDGFTYGGGGGTIAIGPSDNSIIMVGTEAGIFRSEDGGRLWSEANSGINRANILTVAVNPSNPNFLYAGCDGAFYISPDRGNTWQVSLNGMGGHEIIGITVDPVSANVIYCGEKQSPIYKSTDNGGEWKVISTGIQEQGGEARSIVINPVNTNIVYVGMALDANGRHNPRGVLKSNNGGASWVESNSGLTNFNVYALIMNPLDTNILYAGTGGDGVFKTVNGAAAWHESNTGLTNLDVRALAIDPINVNVIYAGTYGGGIFKSTDSGANWTAVNSGLMYNYINSLAIDNINSNNVYAGSFERRIYRSINGGHTWWSINVDLPGTIYIVTSPSNPNQLYIGSTGGGVNLLEVEAANITVTSPNGGESLDMGSTHLITWSAAGIVDMVKIEYSADSGDSWSSITPSTTNDGYYSWTVPNVISSQCLIRISEAHVGTPSDTSDSVFSITEAIPPQISLNRSHFSFGAIESGEVTPPQFFLINNSGGGTLRWSIVDIATWMNCNPVSGTGPETVAISVDSSGLSAGTYNGTITVNAIDATNSPQIINVALKVYKVRKSETPFGHFATPEDGSTVRSSIPVTGWALDDIGVENVKIYREEAGNLVYIGDAVFIEGARPDVEQAFPDYPMNYKAGWGYMMLTNFLPNGGNGTYKLYAIAADVEGNQITLGTRTITCDNAYALKPFGAIDTPEQGGVASGSSFRNHGWVLTPPPNSIPTDGSTINVFVDGVNLGHPTYNVYRSDIAALFPGYANNDGAHAYFDFDTTAYDNGVHSIYWTAGDSAGNSDGIGSRFFTIQNIGNSGPMESALRYQQHVNGKEFYTFSQIAEIPVNALESIKIKKNFRANNGFRAIAADEKDTFNIKIRELERIVIELSSESTIMGGYTIIGNKLRPLPIGSTLDTRKGIFYWQPGPAFIGEYRFVFVEKIQNGEMRRKNVIVKIEPKFPRIVKTKQ